MRNCTIGGTAPSTLFTVIGDAGQGAEAHVFVEGCDLSGGGSSMVFGGSISGASRLLIRGCTLPASWNGSLISGTVEPGAVAVMTDCIISGGARIRLRNQQSTGLGSDETTFIRSGGAEDDGTGISIKVVTTSACAWPVGAYILPEIVYPNTTTGSAITLKIALLIDSATPLTNRDVWVEYEYMGTSSSPLLTTTSTKCATLTSASNLSSSSESWTTTGMSNANKYEISATFTPQVAGDIVVRVYVGKASTTLYVCPKAYV